MNDFDIVSVPAILATPVTTYDASGSQLVDDGEWHRQGAEAQYVLAEFLVGKGLVDGVLSVSRSPNLTIKFSALTDEGRAFAREAVHKWLVSVDRPGATIDDRGLQRRWDKFKAKA